VNPFMTWLLILLGAMSAAPFMFMFGAAVTRRKMEDETAALRVAERRMVEASRLVAEITEVVESEYRYLYPDGTESAPRDMLKTMRGEIVMLRGVVQKMIKTRKVVKA
jgi:hypothetical protein